MKPCPTGTCDGLDTYCTDCSRVRIRELEQGLADLLYFADDSPDFDDEPCIVTARALLGRRPPKQAVKADIRQQLYDALRHAERRLNSLPHNYADTDFRQISNALRIAEILGVPDRDSRMDWRILSATFRRQLKADLLHLAKELVSGVHMASKDQAYDASAPAHKFCGPLTNLAEDIRYCDVEKYVKVLRDFASAIDVEDHDE